MPSPGRAVLGLSRFLFLYSRPIPCAMYLVSTEIILAVNVRCSKRRSCHGSGVTRYAGILLPNWYPIFHLNYQYSEPRVQLNSYAVKRNGSATLSRVCPKQEKSVSIAPDCSPALRFLQLLSISFIDASNSYPVPLSVMQANSCKYYILLLLV
ncbi:hypothetical protein IW261DRAFT_752010 [Armillaria novae-zelandiae]|uniref:Uncharacterized protein n=1 Tax=Armillaria novae-zelandiae TaxID=153914 RepID=A0AA39PKB1_9AGAR|nr:hypothetical protein IW261DRAFT_752010 [Armillaria novae-zelandiae]